MKRLKPALVIGVGGYGSFPAIIAAKILAIPLYILEQNMAWGIVNRYFGRWADYFFVPQKPATIDWPNIQQLGYPIRPEIEKLAQQPINNPSQLKLLVFGGSQGAHCLNQAMLELLAISQYKKLNISIVHQTGAKDLALVTAAAQKSGLDYKVHSFIDDMAQAYSDCSLVLCRSGAGIFELTAAAKPAILVPIINSSGDHQQKNCDFFVAQNAAWTIPQPQLNGQKLWQLLAEITPEQIEEKAKNCRRLHKAAAAEQIARKILAAIDDKP